MKERDKKQKRRQRHTETLIGTEKEGEQTKKIAYRSLFGQKSNKKKEWFITIKISSQKVENNCLKAGAIFWALRCFEY